MANKLPTFRLTTKVIARHAAGRVVCLDRRADGHVFRLHSERPGPHLNDIVTGSHGVGPSASSLANGPALSIVEIRGVLEQRSGWHDPCSGWTDGHDAIAERMISAFGDGDVVMVIDSPGGAHAGLEEAVRRVRNAKADSGRKVYAIADEQIGSAAYWWAASIADEIYTPASGVVGSIGARAAHQSVAGALKKAGVEVEYFVYPGEGKAAFAPEKPLSDIGRERGQRDVNIAGSAFAKAVEVGRGLTLDEIIALDADCLTGQAAVDAGLADGVASLEDVIAHALAMASEQETSMATNKQGARAEDYEPEEKAAARRSEGDEPEAMEPEDEGDDLDEEDEDDEPEADTNAEPEPEDEDDDLDEEDEDDEPEQGMTARGRRPKRRLGGGSSIAEIVGLRRNASDLAVKTEVRRIVSAMRATMGELDVDSIDGLSGAARAVAQDAKQVAQMRASVRTERRRSNAQERMALAKKLASAGISGFTRGELFIDTVAGGKRSTKLAPEYQEMKLSTFRSFVNRKLANAGPRARRVTPFDVERPDAANAGAPGGLAAAMKNPVVIAAAQRGDGNVEKYAKGYLASFAQRPSGDPAL